MKPMKLPCLGLLLLFASTAGADDKAIPGTASRGVRLEKCRITLIDHVTLASDRTGILKQVEFKEGQSAAAGSRVALIADEVAQANLAVAEKKASNEVEVNFAKLAREAAAREHQRMIDANEASAAKGAGRAVALVEIDKALLAADKARLSIQQAEHELALNKLNASVTAAELRTYSVLAEFDGVVTRVFKKKGEAVRQGDPVAELINTDRVRVEGRVALSDLRFAKQGAKVLVRLSVDEHDLPEEKEVFDGRITFVDVVSDPILGTTRVYAEVRNRDNILRAGLMAEMEIEVEAAPGPRAENPDRVEQTPKTTAQTTPAR
jgi:multidrug efflux pump subunit AcrA (membrane-fusion protein)